MIKTENKDFIVNSYIVPHPPLAVSNIGNGEELKIQKTLDAYNEIALEISEIKPDTIVFITPHSVMYGDYIHISKGPFAKGDFSNFRASEVKFKTRYDLELIREIDDMCNIANFPAGILGEKNPQLDHGVMVPMYFINKKYEDYNSVRISISGLSFRDHYRFGMMVKDSLKKLNRKAVIIASGDLSHRLTHDGPYEYSEDGKKFDDKIVSIIQSGNFLEFFDFSEDFCESAGECGLRSFIIMSGILDKMAVKSKLLSYEGPFGVGYAIGSFKVIGEDEERCFLNKYDKKSQDRISEIRKNESPYVSLARRTLEEYVKNKRNISIPDGFPNDMLNIKAGVFVSLKKEGKLRGCIGTISPSENNIALEIMRNAISSGLNDPRFDAVKEDELDSLEYSVDVLGEAEKIKSKDLLDVKEYGVIVSKGVRRGLLLPNLEGVNTVDEQISIALKKAGISPHEKYSLERFKVERFK